MDNSNGVVTARLLERGIIENIVHRGANVEVEDIHFIKITNTRLAEGDYYCVMLVQEELTSISKEAKELVASDSFVQKTIAHAIVVTSLAQRMVANIYMRVNRPKMRTRAFKTREEAIAWLQKHYKAHQKLHSTSAK